MGINELKNKLLKMIIKKSFNYSEEPIYKLASGTVSQYYFDCRATTTDPEGLYLIGEILFDMISSHDITALGGLTMGSDPIAYSVSYTSYLKGKPVKAFVIRKEPKKHGLKKLIEGNVAEGEKVIIIDDVITTGGSTIKAINEARNAGLIVDSVFVLIDRQEGGRENIEELGLKVNALFSREDIMKEYNS